MVGKRILFVLPWLSLGGLERAQVSLANALVRHGFDVTVMTLQEGDELKSQLDKRVHFVFKEPRPFKFMRRIPYIRHKFYDDGMWETRASAKTLYKYYVGNEKYDVEIAFFRGLSIKIISGSTNNDSTKLAWVHSDFLKCAGISNNFKNFRQVRKAYSNFDHIVCVSREAANGFIKKIGCSERVHAIYNVLPVDEILKQKEKKCGTEKNGFTILSVGHLVDEKGYDRLLSVTKNLNEAGYRFTLWIVGYGVEHDKLQEYISENNMTNVKLLGKQANPYAYMNEADLYVCSSRYEGYNLTVAEALICGLPVLSTNCTGPNEILDNGKYGMIVDNSEEGLYNGIKDFLDNPELINKYKEKAAERIGFFDEEQIIKQITGLFERA